MTDIATAVDDTFRISDTSPQDLGRGLVRLHPRDMQRLGLRSGDVVVIRGERNAVAKVMLAHEPQRQEGRVQIDGILRESLGSGLDELIRLEKVNAARATSVTLKPLSVSPHSQDLEYLANLLDGVPVTAGTRVCATLFGSESIDFNVLSTTPEEPVIITSTTRIEIADHPSRATRRNPSYEDIGGAKPQLQRIREMIELPLRYPELFERLGVAAPGGVLLYGPPGCGKTLIARTIAHECDANFYCISGPEVIHKHYGESEAHLRRIFEEASKRGPSIIFLDEIDCIAPKRELAAGDVERRVVAQLLTLLDGLNRRGRVIVIAATNRPNAIDPALRRPGRFDREIEITIPDRNDRLRILQIHTRGMPLHQDVSLTQIANLTHGFVGADLEAVCREAAMSCICKFVDQSLRSKTKIPYDQLAALRVNMQDFDKALQSVVPSAIREVLVEVPQVHWSEVGGLDEVKQKLQEAVSWPIRYSDAFRDMKVKPPRGILLCGPPGCGKTLLAKAVATESQVNFIAIKGPELLSRYVGDSERAVREIFSKARQAAPCILFFDEIDGLGTTRSAGQQDSGVSGRVLTQLLTELDGIEELSGVFVLAATNRVDLIDPALRRFGRFEETIEIPLPSRSSRTEIFNAHLRQRPLADDINIDELAILAEGFSGADIAAVCSQAARQVIRESVNDSSVGTHQKTPLLLRMAHLTTAINSFIEQRDLHVKR